MFRFDPSDQSTHEIDKETYIFDVSAIESEDTISSFRFGGSYFLGRLLPGIEYDSVLDSIETKKPDRLRALFHYYLLSPKADMHSNIWFDKNVSS